MIDVEALKKAPVAILGGGAVGKTCGADCALAGQEVRRFRTKLLERRPNTDSAEWEKPILLWQPTLLQNV